MTIRRSFYAYKPHRPLIAQPSGAPFYCQIQAQARSGYAFYLRKKYEKAAKLWSSIFKTILEWSDFIASIVIKLWRDSHDSQKDHYTLNNLNTYKPPKWFPEDLQISCARDYADVFVERLKSETIDTIDALSILHPPKLKIDNQATEKAKQAFVEKIRETGQEQTIQLGWAIDFEAPAGQDVPKISDLFIDAFIKANLKNHSLTIESPPQTKGSLKRLIENFKTTKHLTLSASIEDEITEEFVAALDNLDLTKITFKVSAGYPSGQFEQNTWRKLKTFLEKDGLDVALDDEFKRPTEEQPWMKKLDDVELDLEPSDPRTEFHLEQIDDNRQPIERQRIIAKDRRGSI